MRKRARFLGFLFLLLMAAGILVAVARLGLIPRAYDPLSPIDLTVPPNTVTGVKLWLMEGDVPACLQALERAGVAVRPQVPRREPPDCSREGTVEVSKLWRAGLDPEVMQCGIALRLYLFERHGLQPLARRYFGSAVERITHFGSYSCRRKRGGGSMSEHATANAFDISGFRLANGQVVSLKKDWTSGGPSSRFLRDVRINACLQFNMVLGPDYNADHADHFHVDMGWAMGCH